jgi:hypothetical protein
MTDLWHSIAKLSTLFYVLGLILLVIAVVFKHWQRRKLDQMDVMLMRQKDFTDQEKQILDHLIEYIGNVATEKKEQKRESK